jgi:hypothetical protein
MGWRPHPKDAEVDADHPVPWATCDSCGFIWNHPRLAWQHQWAGTGLINLRQLKCPRCLDEPQEQLRVIVLPPDPDPLFNARPEQYAIDEGFIAAFTASIAPDPNHSNRGIMTVTNVSSGVVSTGAVITQGAQAGTIIGDQLSGSGPPGGDGTYVVTPSQTIASTPMTSNEGQVSP